MEDEGRKMKGRKITKDGRKKRKEDEGRKEGRKMQEGG